MFVRVQRRFCSARRMRRRFVVLVTIRFICVTSLRVDMYELDLPSQVKSHVATYVKTHLVCWFISLPFLLIFEKVARILPEPLCVAFFYCEIDGSSLCLQCDMIVHVGGKRTHRRYLLLRQRAEFPGDKPGSLDVPGSVRSNLGQAKREPTHISSLRAKEKQQNDQVSPNPFIGSNGKMENKMIDLNARPQRMHGQVSNNQEREDNSVDGNHDTESVVPDGFFKREP